MRLTKHHAHGNDFLVLLDPGGVHPLSPDRAVALCHRHTGIGADGVMRVTAGTHDADVTMQLLNADGTTAEISGNGIRCLAQAVFRAGLAAPPVLTVATEAGVRTVTAIDRIDHRTQRLSVDMGQVKVVEDVPEWVEGDVLHAVHVHAGNPHIVLHWGGPVLPVGLELIALGARIDDSVSGGANVEVIRPDGAGGLEMVVYERGVGPTLACGSGACASAAAAAGWELVGDSCQVAMPGGPVEVTLGDPVMLTGLSTFVATIELDQR